MPDPRMRLLVEGTSDFGVFRELWKRLHDKEEPPFTLDTQFGLQGLRERFSALLLGSEVDRLGIVVDADDGVEARWPGFYQILVERGYRPVPKRLPVDGLVLERPDLTVGTVGVWLMPDNASPGALEDFVQYLVPPGDELWRHAGEVVETIPRELKRFTSRKQLKAHVYSWLAWQKEPGLRLGPAIERRLLDTDAPHAASFIVWLRRLFTAPRDTL